MANRKLNPMRSTLPGPKLQPKLSLPAVYEITTPVAPSLKDIAIPMWTHDFNSAASNAANSMDQWADTFRSVYLYGHGWIDGTPLTPEQVEARSIAAEERKAEAEAKIATQKKRHDADEKAARELHTTALDRCTDQTLAKVIERHSVDADWWGEYGRVECDECRYDYPCNTMTMISEDLDRRVVTDPLVADGMPGCLLDGGL